MSQPGACSFIREIRRPLALIFIFAIFVAIAFRFALYGNRSAVEIGMIMFPLFFGVTVYELRICLGLRAAMSVVFLGSIFGAICFSSDSLAATLKGDEITNGFLVGSGWDFVLVGVVIGALIGVMVSPVPLCFFIIYVLARGIAARRKPHE